MQFYLITALVFSLLVAIFAVQNTETVVIRFLAWRFSVSLVLVLLGSAAAGALVLYFFGLFKQVGSWFKIRQLNGKREDLEKQVARLEEKLKRIENEQQKETGTAVKESGEESK